MCGLDKAVRVIFEDYQYKVLSGVELKKIPRAELKKAFLRKVKSTHPDRAVVLGKKSSELEIKFREVNEAYSLIMKYYDSSNNFNEHKKFKTSSQNPLKDNDFMYQYTMPSRRLRFAEFLFYKKIISWNELIAAIVYQNSRYIKIGEVAVSMAVLKQHEVDFIMSWKYEHEKFGEAAVRLGLIDMYKLFVILGTQKRKKIPIGRYFIDSNILSHEQLEKYLCDFNIWNRRFI